VLVYERHASGSRKRPELVIGGRERLPPKPQRAQRRNLSDVYPSALELSSEKRLLEGRVMSYDDGTAEAAQ
jgi:hypothetical protein